MIFKKLNQSYRILALAFLTLALHPPSAIASSEKGLADYYTSEQPLTEILKEMGEKYQVFFTYEANLLQNVEVDFEFKSGESLENAISRLLSNTGFQYQSYGDKYVVIFQNTKRGKKGARKLGRKIRQLKRLEDNQNLTLKRKSPQPKELLRSVAESIAAMKAAVTVRGTVRDEEGAPLFGVNILIKGTGSGTVTDLDGKFSLELPTGDETLVLSYTGYETLEVPVNGQQELTIVMSESISELEEVVVVGYGTVRKRDLTGSVGSLEGKEFEGEVISNVSQGLQGKVAGVNVTTNGGAPGGAMVVRIRGNNSVIGGNDPLYVID